MDCISSLTGSNGCNLNSSFKGSDLPELFSKLGLGKYTDVFQQQEIDLQTFLTLTDQDLKELGITTFGARRKMLLAISELNKNRRKLFEPPSARTSFLEGGASGRLPRQYHADIASVSGRW
nr:BicC family RNA binding protein 1 [Molossus molossus]